MFIFNLFGIIGGVVVAGAYILTRFRFAPQSSFFIVLLRYPDTLSIICLPTIYNPLISIEISFLNNYEQWWSLGNLLMAKYRPIKLATAY